MGCGTVTLCRRRVRGLEQRFESRVLPMFARRTAEINKLVPQLYLHGLALGDFDLALRGLLGEEAPVSASTVARLKGSWQAEWEEWKKRPLNGQEVLFMWVDGVYVKAGLEKEKAPLLVVVGGLLDGRKAILAVEPGYRESTAGWSEVLRDLKERGLNCPRLVIGDGNLGIWGALANVYPEAAEQRCWNHKIVNVLAKLPKKVQPQAKRRLQDIAYAENRPQAEEKRDLFLRWCHEEDHRAAGETLTPGPGRDGRLLPVPEGALEAPADNQWGGIALWGPETKDGCRQAVQEGGECHRRHLENAHAGGTEIPAARCAGEADAGLLGIWRRRNTTRNRS